MGVSINHAAVPALFFVLLRLYYAQNNASLIFAGLPVNSYCMSYLGFAVESCLLFLLDTGAAVSLLFSALWNKYYDDSHPWCIGWCE